MEQQRERARASWKGAEKGAVVPAYQKLLEGGRTKFLGYADLESASRVIGLLRGTASWWMKCRPACARNWCSTRRRSTRKPADRWATRARCTRPSGEKVADVETAFPGVPGLTVHRILTHAPIRTGDILRGEGGGAVARRHAAQSHRHAPAARLAAHRCWAAHVKQAGSVVEPGRLRFDFTHYAAMDRAEIEEVERLMNERDSEERDGRDRT